MPAKEHAQTLADFCNNPTATFDRVNLTNEPQIIMAEGQARAALLSPTGYDAWLKEVQMGRDVAVQKTAWKQYRAANLLPVNEMFDQPGTKAANFHQTVTQSFDRLDQTREAEIITVDGQPRAVILSLAAYDELADEVLLSRDVEVIRRSMQQYAEGKSQPAEVVFREIRAKLLKMKADQEKAKAEMSK